jgi:hypothetical protein
MLRSSASVHRYHSRLWIGGREADPAILCWAGNWAMGGGGGRSARVALANKLPARWNGECVYNVHLTPPCEGLWNPFFSIPLCSIFAFRLYDIFNDKLIVFARVGQCVCIESLFYYRKTYALICNWACKPGFCIRRRSGTHVIPTLARSE